MKHISYSIGVNKQNCRIWGSENPQVIEEGPLHSEKIESENDDETTATINSERLWSYDNRLFIACY